MVGHLDSVDFICACHTHKQLRMPFERTPPGSLGLPGTELYIATTSPKPLREPWHHLKREAEGLQDVKSIHGKIKEEQILHSDGDHLADNSVLLSLH